MLVVVVVPTTTGTRRAPKLLLPPHRRPPLFFGGEERDREMRVVALFCSRGGPLIAHLHAQPMPPLGRPEGVAARPFLHLSFPVVRRGKKSVEAPPSSTPHLPCLLLLYVWVHLVCGHARGDDVVRTARSDKRWMDRALGGLPPSLRSAPNCLTHPRQTGAEIGCHHCYTATSCAYVAYVRVPDREFCPTATAGQLSASSHPSPSLPTTAGQQKNAPVLKGHRVYLQHDNSGLLGGQSLAPIESTLDDSWRDCYRELTRHAPKKVMCQR